VRARSPLRASLEVGELLCGFAGKFVTRFGRRDGECPAQELEGDLGVAELVAGDAIERLFTAGSLTTSAPARASPRDRAVG